MQAVGETIIIKLVKDKKEHGETVLENGLIAVGSTSDDSVNEVLSKWEGEVVSIGEKVGDSPVEVGKTVRIMENSGLPVIEEESDTQVTRYVSVRYGDIIAVM